MLSLVSCHKIIELKCRQEEEQVEMGHLGQVSLLSIIKNIASKLAYKLYNKAFLML